VGNQNHRHRNLAEWCEEIIQPEREAEAQSGVVAQTSPAAAGQTMQAGCPMLLTFQKGKMSGAKLLKKLFDLTMLSWLEQKQ